MPGAPRRRAREGNGGTALPPARPAHTPSTGSSGKPLPGLPPTLRPQQVQALLLPSPRSCHPARAGDRVKDRAQPGRAAAPAGRPRRGRPRADNATRREKGTPRPGTGPSPNGGPALHRISALALDFETKRCSIGTASSFGEVAVRFETPFTRLVGCRAPIQLAVMGGGTGTPELAASVSEAGGLGMISSTFPLPVNAQLSWVQARTDGPVGVGFFAF